MRNEAPDLRVVVDVKALVEIILRERPPVRHEQRGRVVDARLGDQLHHVLVERHDRIGVLVARIPVEGLGQVHLEVQAAFGRRHQIQLARRHDDPLALLAVAGHVFLDRMHAVELAVAAQGISRIVQALEILVPEDARAGVIDPRAEQVARFDLI